MAELLLTAEKAPEPGTLTMREILHRGDEDLPAAMVVKALDSAGWVYLYDTQTRERSLCNRNMLPDALKKKRPDGSRIFTTVSPKSPAARGKVKCMLHPKGPDRALYDSMGLPVCTSGHLQNDYELGRHMRNRHQSAWEAIQSLETKKKEQAELEFRRLLLEQATGRAERPPVRGKKA